MNKFKSFFRNYKYELYTSLVDMILIFIAYFTVSQFYIILISFFVLLFSTFFIIYIKTKEKDFYFYPFDKPEQAFDWVGRGDLKFIRNEKCFEITHSDVGYILPKTSNWDDYKFVLDFKIATSSLGFIVRADNLSNYLMYQIFNNRIKSHLRINGSWIVISEDNFDSNNLSLDNWYKLIVTTEKRGVRIQIKNKNQDMVDRHFSIPQKIILTKKEIREDGAEITNTIKFEQNIDFDFGAVGLRNCEEERALVKNIFIEKL